MKPHLRRLAVQSPFGLGPCVYLWRAWVPGTRPSCVGFGSDPTLALEDLYRNNGHQLSPRPRNSA